MGLARTIPAAHSRGVSSVAFSFRGDLLASGGRDSKVRVWNAATGSPAGRPIRRFAIVFSVAFSPDGTVLACGGKSGTVWLFDVRSGKKIRTLRVPSGIGHFWYVWALAFSPDGALLASAGGYGIRLWDIPAGHLAANCHGQPAVSVAFSSRGTLLASGSQDGTIRLWDMPSGRLITAFARHSGAVQSVALSKDGTILASGAGGVIRTWEARTGRNILTLNGSASRRLLRPATSISLHPDNVLLASNEGREIHLWDMETGRKITTLTGHTAEVQSVAFSLDGSQLASGSLDETIRLWTI